MDGRRVSARNSRWIGPPRPTQNRNRRTCSAARAITHSRVHAREEKKDCAGSVMRMHASKALNPSHVPEAIYEPSLLPSSFSAPEGYGYIRTQGPLENQ